VKLPIQKILFGSPGTGKSHRIEYEIVPKELGIENRQNIVKTVFHPEYTYGDFMGKLVPITKSTKVEYHFYEGHFLKALARAYRNILSRKDDEEVKNVALVIDEINRGNSSAIFGTIFQLLDRGEDGWSDYAINVSELELHKILLLIGFDDGGNVGFYKYGKAKNPKALEEYQDVLSKIKIYLDGSNVVGSSVRIPPNLSILATMNTSDNSIYFMDSAFKRRWDWEFINWDDSKPPAATYGKGGTLEENDWRKLIKNLNGFIKNHHASVRGIEDKQIGYYFIKQPVTAEQIQNKLMFFLWDSVFNRDKKPLLDLLNKKRERDALLTLKRDDLVTFGDFTKLHNEFIENIMDDKG
jgi:5-methylcytosine-specific restriction endonuclease McrBC GTP-binding regulatory subunit McrB